MSHHHASKSGGKKADTDPDVVALVLRDHVTVKDLYKKIQSENDHDAENLYQKMCWEIALHAVAEELVVYPLQEHMDKEGKQLAKESREDHEKTKAALQELDGKTLKENGVREKVDAMMKDLIEHMEKEETADLPKLKEGLSEDALKTAGHDFQQVKSLIPDVAAANQAHSEKQADKGEKDSHFKTPMSLLLAPKDKIKAIIGEHGAKEAVSVNKGSHKEDSHYHSKKGSPGKSHHDGHSNDSHDGGKSHTDDQKSHGHEEGAEIPYNLRHRDEKGHVVPDDAATDAGGKAKGKATDGEESPSRKGHAESDEQNDVDMASQGSRKGHAGEGKNGHHKNGDDHHDGDMKNQHGKRTKDDPAEPTSHKKAAGTRKSGEMDVDGGDSSA